MLYKIKYQDTKARDTAKRNGAVWMAPMKKWHSREDIPGLEQYEATLDPMVVGQFEFSLI